MKRTLGALLIVVGVVGLVLMLSAAAVTIHQGRTINQRADDILVPLAGGAQSFQEQLDATEQLVDELLAVVPTSTIVDLAGQLAELTTRLETLNGYLNTARQVVTGLDGLPFLPIDLSAIESDLDDLETGLATLTVRLEELSGLVLENQDVPAQIAAGVGEAINEVRTGIDNAQAEVGRISDAVDRWLVTGLVTVLVLLTFGVAGQVALIQLGRLQRRGGESSAAEGPDDAPTPA